MNPLDKIFKTKLAHYTTDVPEDAWLAIEKKLPSRKQSIWSPYFFTGSALVLAMVFCGYAFLNWKETRIPSVLSKADKVQSLLAVSEAANIKKSGNEDINCDHNRSTNEMVFEKTAVKKDVPIVSYQKEKTLNILKSPDIIALGEEENKEASQDIADIDVNSFEFRQEQHVATLGNALNGQKMKSYRTLTLTNAYNKEKTVKTCPFVYDTQNKSVDVYFSHDYAFRQLTPIAPGYADYSDMRHQTEKSMYSFSAGARIGYNLSYRWNLHTGFNYSQLNEKFEYIDPESNQTRLITIKDYIYQNGKIVDSSTTEQLVIIPGTKVLKIYNKYRTFDVPVIGRYTLYANRQLSLSAMAGVFINLAFNQRGMILDKDNVTLVDIAPSEDESQNVFKTQLGISGYTALSMAFHIHSSLDLLVEPNIRVQLESITNAGYPLSQRYNTFGLSTGFRYKF